MAYPTGIEFKPTSPTMGVQPIQETSTTKKHELGTIVRATDVNYGEGEFVYLLGAASTDPGDLVCYNSKTGATVRTAHAATGSNGPCGVAMSANVANQYGWYQISGSGPVKSGTVLADASLYITATAGSVDDASVAGDLVDGLLSKADTVSGFTTCQFSRPNIVGLGGAAQTTSDNAFSGLNTMSGVTGITAFATGGQGSATALTKNTNFITVCATNADSVKLPTGALGMVVTVFNLGAANASVYPVSGAQIDALGANAAYTVNAAASRVFHGLSATQWHSKS